MARKRGNKFTQEQRNELMRQIQYLEMKGYNTVQISQRLDISTGQVSILRNKAYDLYVQRNRRNREQQIYMHELRLEWLWKDAVKQYLKTKKKEINCKDCNNDPKKRDGCAACGGTGKINKIVPASPRHATILLDVLDDIAKLGGLNAPSKVASLSALVPWEELVGEIRKEAPARELPPTPEEYFASYLQHKQPAAGDQPPPSDFAQKPQEVAAEPPEVLPLHSEAEEVTVEDDLDNIDDVDEYE